MEAWIENYGYLAVLLGTFLEGETILILAGFAAHRGYLELPWVIMVAFIGTLSGDQLFFFLGRKHSAFLLRHKPHWRPRLERVQRLTNKYQILIILGFRFLYGIRTVTPFALGMNQITYRLFIPLNILGALVWAVAIGIAGYFFGQALEVFLGNLKRYEMTVLIILAGVGGILWGLHFMRARRLSGDDHTDAG